MNICFYGSASQKINTKYTDEAYRLGREISLKGHCLVFGGGDTGMMGACAKGVHDNGGKSIGIAPNWIEKFQPLCKECETFIYVDSIDERKKKFVENSEAFIVAPGGIGTFDEFFEIITLKKLKQNNKEIVIFNIDGFYNKMFEMIEEMIEEGFINKPDGIYKIANSIDEIFEYLE